MNNQIVNIEKNLTRYFNLHEQLYSGNIIKISNSFLEGNPFKKIKEMVVYLNLFENSSENIPIQGNVNKEMFLRLKPFLDIETVKTIDVLDTKEYSIYLNDFTKLFIKQHPISFEDNITIFSLNGNKNLEIDNEGNLNVINPMNTLLIEFVDYTKY